MTIQLFKVFMADDVPARVGSTLMSGYIGEGRRVQEFEEAFGLLVGSPSRPLALNSCTSALDLALHLAGVKLGSEVITTPMTCTATNSVIANRGAKIVWADVDPYTGLIDPVDVANKITGRTRAIMAVDWGGQPCDYYALRLVADRYPTRPIPIIQDAAHNLLADLSKDHGDYVCWSFQAIKHLTTGDGGALLVPEGQRERARLLRWYGLDRESSADFRCAQTITENGFKYHMNDIAASIGLANIEHAPNVVMAHTSNAKWYDGNIRETREVRKPEFVSGSWWLYTLLVDDRDAFTAHMAERGVAVSPVHRRNDEHPSFDVERRFLKGVDYFAAHETAVPVGWWVSEADRQIVADAVNAYSTADRLVAA